ncbi:enoyl-CoA hydratase/isomerase family protein [Actinoplanes derwentensis]|uniref:3-hydroxyisobutyryl-CoA hydrolase n=1 Tax=Actinoplanes derwentensis TaxID=113562 RepID=A0A1H1TNC7_9ACTN|nr:enoyl-CoA hydratase/isomerase family protein [Actinoplanes derwentensis]GID85080.1 putative enoyl-CoA hydratase [Actinoplanes derwentensis]SDS61561.1 enoyl-CoA hydratase [Actinoplanes derwentensis]
MCTSPVLTIVEGQLGQVILNRPEAINALTAEMVGLVADVLREWESDDRVRTVLITGAGERGLCAGGDLRAMHADAVSGGTGSLEFWAREYDLNAAIAGYPKPIVAWMDGLVMGGGIGVSAHASLRIVTERSRLAMPEVGIGFHPDVGGSWLLSRAPGELGTHLALTGTTIGAGDAITVGLADCLVRSERLPYLIADWKEGVAVTPGDRPVGELGEAREWIDECYAGDDLAVIRERLAAHPVEAARAAAKQIDGKSPTSLAVTLRSLRTAAGLPDLRAALDQEYRLSAALLRLPDLAEGIRAQIIDKDRRPRWSQVPPGLMESLFRP